MAIAKPISLLKSISGKLAKAEDQVFYVKFGKNFVWNNKGVHTFNTAQIAAQTLLAQAAAQVSTIMANATQKATYLSSFKAQSKYQTLRGYMMATVIDQLQNQTQD